MWPPYFDHPPYSPNRSWLRLQIWHEYSPGKYFWGHRGDFWNSTPEPRYGGRSISPLGGIFPHISAQGQKFKNRLDDPKSMVKVSIHANFQVCTMFGIGCRGGWSESRGATSSNLGNPVISARVAVLILLYPLLPQFWAFLVDQKKSVMDSWLKIT